MWFEKTFMIFALPFIRIGQIFGLCPFNVNNGRAFLFNQKSFAIISIAYCLLHLIHFLHSLWCLDYWLGQTKAILTYIDFFWVLIARCQVFAMLIECFFKRNTQINIINSLNLLNKILTQFLHIKNDQKQLNKIFWFNMCGFFAKVLLTVAIFLIKPTVKLKYYNMLFSVSHILKYFQTNLFLIYVYSLMYNIQMLNCHLLTTRCNTLFCFNENKFRFRIVYYFKCFSSIWKITKMIDQWIFWSILTGFIYNFVSIIATLYWIFVRFFSPTFLDSVAFASGIMILVESAIEILQICDACDRVVDEVKDFDCMIHCCDK